MWAQKIPHKANDIYTTQTEVAPLGATSTFIY